MIAQGGAEGVFIFPELFVCGSSHDCVSESEDVTSTAWLGLIRFFSVCPRPVDARLFFVAVVFSVCMISSSSLPVTSFEDVGNASKSFGMVENDIYLPMRFACCVSAFQLVGPVLGSQTLTVLINGGGRREVFEPDRADPEFFLSSIVPGFQVGY